MKKSSILSAAALTGAAALLLAGCAGSGGGTPTEGGDGGGDAAGRACVILPDAASSPRWENFDRKYLQEGLEGAGFEVDIQNAQGDVNKYSTIADQQLTQGCGVMLLVDYQGAAEAVAAKAKAEGIPVIAYDRPFTGADYYVSFDNVEVGRLEGQTVLDGLETAGKDPATAVVVYMGGDPTDGNAAMFHDGAVEVMEAAGIVAGSRAAGSLGPGQVADQLRAGSDLARRQGRRRVGCERHERRGRHQGAAGQQPDGCRGLGPGRQRRGSAEHPPRLADGDRLQAGEGRGHGRRRHRGRAAERRDARSRRGAGRRHAVHPGHAAAGRTEGSQGRHRRRRRGVRRRLHARCRSLLARRTA